MVNWLLRLVLSTGPTRASLPLLGLDYNKINLTRNQNSDVAFAGDAPPVKSEEQPIQKLSGTLPRSLPANRHTVCPNTV